MTLFELLKLTSLETETQLRKVITIDSDEAMLMRYQQSMDPREQKLAKICENKEIMELIYNYFSRKLVESITPSYRILTESEKNSQQMIDEINKAMRD